MTKPNTSTAENVEAIWVNKSSKTGFQVMGCGSHFHGENMALYVSMDVLNAAIARAEQAEARVAELEAERDELARIAGGGCESAGGGNHTVVRQGSYSFCSACGESLKGVRFCHEPRAALSREGGE
jgi:hypothetical protein